MVTKTVYNKFTETEERTALSVLLGLRQKFALQLNEEINYTPKELHEMISYLLKQVKRKKINQVDLAYAINPPEKIPDEVWGIVDKAVNRSKIKRYNWKLVLNGNTLTKEILLLKKDGKDVLEAYNILLNDKRINQFIEEHPYEKEDILKNIEISVHARYGENNTAKKVMEIL
jgi:hypothetical protein